MAALRRFDLTSQLVERAAPLVLEALAGASELGVDLHLLELQLMAALRVTALFLLDLAKL